MSYIVLARKWRPQNFDDLTGQESVVRTIKNALSGGKMVHAYLFSGPRGVGKTSAARILAKALNCAKGPSAEPCGECQNCKAVTDGASLDVFEIDGASNTGVDDVRELRETVKYAPSGGKYKIYIIDEVHMLSTQAFNALLKTLEEPPPHVIFVFATTEPKKIPLTIISRCQHHIFRRIPKTKIKDLLLKISETENIKITETAVEMIARASDGSMRDALTILDKASSFSDDISEKELQILLGLPETDIIINLSETILSGDISTTLSIIKELTERGYDLRAIVKELVEHFRNIAIVKVVQSPDEFLEFTQEEIQKLQQQASKINMEELTLLLTEIFKLESEVRSSINPRYSLELGLLRTSFIKGMTSINDILKTLGNTEQTLMSTVVDTEDNENNHLLPLPTGQAGPPATCAPRHKGEQQRDYSKGGKEKFEVQKNKDALWSDVTEKLKARDHLLACKLAEAKIISITDAELTIGFNGGMSVLADSVKKNAPLVETAIKESTGNKLRLKIVSLPAEDLPALPTGQAGGRQGTTLREEKKSIDKIEEVSLNPVVKNAIELFNGKLLEVKSLKKNDYTD